MNMRKRLLALALAAVMALSMVACSADDAADTTSSDTTAAVETVESEPTEEVTEEVAEEAAEEATEEPAEEAVEEVTAEEPEEELAEEVPEEVVEEPEATPEPTPEATPEPSEEPVVEVVAEATTYTVIDALGREVEIPANPQRAIGLTSAASEALRLLGIPQVGKVSAYKIDTEVLSLPSIGSTSSLNMETIYSLTPDLIIAQARTHTALEESLELSGAAVYYFDSDLSGEISIVDLIPYLGSALNLDTEGAAYKSEITALASVAAAEVAAATDFETALIIQHGDAVTCAITSSGYGSMLQLLELENIVPDGLPGSDSGSFVTYDMEAIIAADPDVILVIISSADEAERAAIIESYTENPLWAGLSATQNGSLVALPYLVNPNLSTTVDMMNLTKDAVIEAAK